jgi:hypothetical protein
MAVTLPLPILLSSKWTNIQHSLIEVNSSAHLAGSRISTHQMNPMKKNVGQAYMSQATIYANHRDLSNNKNISSLIEDQTR